MATDSAHQHQEDLLAHLGLTKLQYAVTAEGKYLADVV